MTIQETIYALHAKNIYDEIKRVRYLMERTWDSSKSSIAIIMYNPVRLDPHPYTIWRTLSAAVAAVMQSLQHNFGSIRVVNLIPHLVINVVSKAVVPAISAEKKITFNNLIIHTDFGISDVSGEVTNSDTKAHPFTMIVSFYDENKKLIGAAQGVVNNIDAGDTKFPLPRIIKQVWIQ